jgi:hypothetical protein
MVNKRIYWWLENSKSLSQEQAGFRIGCRIEDHLFRFTQRIHDGFQKGEHTVIVSIDLQQAYDRVWGKGF